MTKRYFVFERVNEGTKFLAEVIGGKVTGPEAKFARYCLLEAGWPMVTPDIALHGMYLFAVPVAADEPLPPALERRAAEQNDTPVAPEPSHIEGCYPEEYDD